jgi:hypothetical protein
MLSTAQLDSYINIRESPVKHIGYAHFDYLAGVVYYGRRRCGSDRLHIDIQTFELFYIEPSGDGHRRHIKLEELSLF